MKDISNIRCKNCKYIFPLKERIGREWIYRDICALFPITDGGKDAFAIVVDKDHDHCEMFYERE